MVFFISVVKGVRANKESEGNHTNFKCKVVYNIDAKQRQAAHK